MAFSLAVSQPYTPLLLLNSALHSALKKVVFLSEPHFAPLGPEEGEQAVLLSARTPMLSWGLRALRLDQCISLKALSPRISY